MAKHTWGRSPLIFLLLLLIWYILGQLKIWSSFVLPPPAAVYAAFLEMLSQGELLEAIGISLERILLGFSLAALSAFALTIMTVYFPKLQSYYQGLLNFLRNVPPLTLIPLLILWFGIGEASKLIIIILASFFPLYLNLSTGFTTCDAKLLEVGKVFGFKHSQLLKKIILPYALPYIVVGIRLALGYSLRAIIGAEMIAASSGLGYLILDSQTMARSDKVLVGIITIGILGLLLDSFFALLLKHYFPYRRELHL